ncbi:MAG: DUF4434 domain-containing protein [Clostridia bacterium]|nr:DUF4434 domain-containing protein [Clostridia bacterium]
MVRMLQRGFVSIVGVIGIIFVLFYLTLFSNRIAVDWEPDNAYIKDDIVRFDGTNYQCIKAHQALKGAEPPKEPALWKVHNVRELIFSDMSIDQDILSKQAVNISGHLQNTANKWSLSGSIAVDVSDAQTGLAYGFKASIPGLEILADTDQNGSFTLTGILESSAGYILEIDKPGYLKRTIDNIIINSNVTIAQPIVIWAGDIISDGAINMSDIVSLIQYFNTAKGQTGYNPTCDLNQDNAVNMTDIIIICMHFNQTSKDYPAVAIPTPQPTPTAAPSPTPPKLLSGSFIQPYLTDGWNASKFATEYDYMKSVKMDHMIWQWTVDSKNMRAYYPTRIPGLTQFNSYDAVGVSLEQAKIKGMKVWLGLNWTDDWWQKYAYDKAWLIKEFGLSKEIAYELWSRYGGLYKETIAGFYITMEIDNVNFMTSASQDNMKSVYKDLADYIHQNMNKPVMVAPFFNESFGMGAATYGAMWKNILSYAPLDIVALQDGIGVGHCSVKTVGNWFLEMKNAVKTARPATELWSDLETLDLSYKPAPVQRVIEQIRAEANYVDKITSFSFNHYGSPQQGNSVQYNEYKAYVDSLK